MSDEFGNYIPGLKSAGATSTFTEGAIVQGSGVPGADTPSFALGYVDTNTGIFYIHTSTGWTAVSGGGGTTSVFSSATDPSGVLTATGPAICLGTGASDGLMWKKTTAGTNNTDWVAF